MTLQLGVTANLRAELIGSGAHSTLPGAIEVVIGGFYAEQVKRVVLLLHLGATLQQPGWNPAPATSATRTIASVRSSLVISGKVRFYLRWC